MLKDFRDRDELHGSPTLLLRCGKPATGAVSLAWLGWMLQRSRRAEAGRDEQVAIGLGARAGNGPLVGVLAQRPQDVILGYKG